MPSETHGPHGSKAALADAWSRAASEAALVARPMRARHYNASAEADAEASPPGDWVPPNPQATDGRRCRLTAKQMAATS